MSSKKKTEKRACGEGYSEWISSWLESAAFSFNATKSFMMSLKIPGKSSQTIVFEMFLRHLMVVLKNKKRKRKMLLVHMIDFAAQGQFLRANVTGQINMCRIQKLLVMAITISA